MGPLPSAEPEVECVQIICPQCHNPLDYSGEPPSHCGRCGGALVGTEVHSAETLEFPAQSAVDEPAGGAAERVGEYGLVRLLGEGGMGVVWEAEQAAGGRRVAIKLLSPRLARSPDMIERFLREARLAASVSHPRTTFVFGAGEHEGQPYIAMELMPGRTLKDLLQEEGALSPARAVDYILDAIEGLEAVHAVGMVHRDIKPSNCFLDLDDRVKVGDFGLSKSLFDDSALTRSGSFLGTPQFAAPEQIRGTQVDRRTDVYALGATLYCLLANRPPFLGESAAVIAQIASDLPPRLRSLTPHVPRELEWIVHRMLAKDAAKRHASLAELRESLRPFSTRPATIAMAGRRLAAFMLDTFIVSVATFFLALAAGWLIAVFTPAAARSAAQALAGNSPTALWIAIATWLMGIAYFAVAESFLGGGFGKRLTGLTVLGPDGGKAALWRTSLRALFVPGALGVALAPAIYAYFSPPATSTVGEGFFDPMNSLIVALLSLPQYGVMLLTMTSMRAKNGYRGWHGLASGTRVLRIRSSADSQSRRRTPIVAPVAAADLPQRCGPYRVLGELGRDGPTRVLAARDDRLGRSVWILLYDADAPGSPSDRRAVVRATRPHWLQSDDLDGRRWEAYEAVDGSPLLDAARFGALSGWSQVRPLLAGLAEELVAADRDGTLPKSLSVEQIWLDSIGHAKLIDPKLTPPTQAADPFDGGCAGDDRACKLFRAARGACGLGFDLPGHAQSFLERLDAQPNTIETLAWAATELKAHSDLPDEIRWDDRLRLVCVSACTEMVGFTLVTILVGTLVSPLESLSLPVRALACLAAPMGLAALLGGWAQGGPVFKFSRIEVRRHDGRTAGRLRCAVRNVVAWSPLILSFGMLNVTNMLLFAEFNAARTSETAATPLGLWVLPLFCGWTIPAAAFDLGAAIAIVCPARGIQDRLAGTCLVPR